MFKLLLCTCLLSGLVLAEDPKDGMGCRTEGGFTYCEGKSPTYTKLTAGATGGNSSDDGLEARSRGNSNPLMNRQYGIQQHKCDRGSDGDCKTMTTSIFPTLLYNVHNEPRYIVQLGAFKQLVQLNICTGNGCGGRGFCDQKYVNVDFLCLDPHGKTSALLVDSFKIPSCCKCKGGAGSGPGSAPIGSGRPQK